jgi:hypothetical protein
MDSEDSTYKCVKVETPTLPMEKACRMTRRLFKES